MRHPGPNVLAWVFLIVVVAVIAAAVVLLVRAATGQSPWHQSPWHHHPHQPPFDPALGELRTRYARGEIDRDEYFRRAADLGAVMPPAAPAAPAAPPTSPGSGLPDPAATPH